MFLYKETVITLYKKKAWSTTKGSTGSWYFWD